MTDPVVQRTTVPLKLSAKQLRETRCANVLCRHDAGDHRTRAGGRTSYCIWCDHQRRRALRRPDEVCTLSFDDINAGSLYARYGSAPPPVRERKKRRIEND